MFNFLYQIDDIYVFGLVSITIIMISVIALFIIKRYVPSELRYKENAVIGVVTASIGVIYAIIAGITALYLCNINSYTSDAVQHEANAAADIFRESVWLKEPVRSLFQSSVKEYLHNVIEVEWPLMQAGKEVNNKGVDIIYKLNSELSHSQMITQRDNLVTNRILNELKSLFDARQIRVNMSYSELTPEIWFVILLVTVLLIAMNYIFGMHFYLHILSVCVAGLMASSIIFLLVTLDKPFQGQFGIAPDGFISVLKYVEQRSEEIKTR